MLRDRAPNELTFEAVAEAAGVSRALVYNYFGDRNGLLAAVELRTLDELNRELHDRIDATLDPVDQLRPLAETYLEFARAHGPLWAIVLAGEVRHPSVEAARRIRVERLAELWGGTEAATATAHAVTAMLEAATVGWPGTGGAPDRALDVVCSILEAGLAAGLAEVR